MADFYEIQFPTDISYGSEGGPEFLTEVVEFAGGTESRNQVWERSRWRFNAAYGVKTLEQMGSLIAFFMNCKGRAIGFRFKNHDDYEAIDCEIGVGNGSEQHFQLVKTYTFGGYSFDREISKPVSGTVHIFDNDVEQVSGWTVDTTTGLITFSTPPTLGHHITASFEFDIPMRFDTDHIPVNFTTYQLRAAQVPLVELKL